jgi:predicted extracellular nuclease
MTALINEFFFNNAGSDTVEYIEVFVDDSFRGGGLYVLQVEGDVATNTTQRGRIDSVHVVPLPAGGGGGHVLIDLPANTLENGAFTLLLVSAEIPPLASTADDDVNDIDDNNDGVIDAAIPFLVLDAVGIADGAADTTYAGSVRLVNETSAVGGFSRIPDGTDSDTAADWLPNDQALDPGSDADPTPDEGEARNTPGATNAPEVEDGPPTPGVTVGNATPAIAEGQPGGIVTFVLDTQPTADVTITLVPDAQVSLGATSLVFTAANWDVVQQVTVTAIDDAAAEGPHAGTVTTTAASADAGYAGIAVADIAAGITDNDQAAPELTAISAIQGAGHRSDLEGEQVTTTGIVTARSNNGFWLQDPNADEDIATSEGIFVFTGSGPAVSVGDAVQVAGTVTEFTRTTSSPGHLSITQLTAPTVTVVSSGNALPDAVVIGTDRTPPTENTDDDGFTSYDPMLDGVDFWESLEGMRIELPDAMAVSPSFNSTSTSNRAETFAVANQGSGATGLNDAGGLTLAEDDANPERVAVQANQNVLPGADFVTRPGDRLGDVVGVLDYDSRGNFEIVLTEAITVADGGLEKEGTTDLVGDADSLTVGTYNVENLAGTSSAAKFTALGIDIAGLMNSPDIIALQEIQDNNGSTNNGVVDASATYGALIDAIVAAGGPQYTFLNIDPADNTSGGQPGGNIRVGFLYNEDRVDLVAGSLRQVDPANAAAWEASRIPLAADFAFNGEVITVVNNHWASKGGSSPQFGTIQPLLNGSEDQRVLQAASVKGFVDDILADDANANIIVMGDLNEFPWEDSLDIVTGVAAGQPVLFDLLELTEPDPTERYEYVFDGNHQILDHVLASGNLVQGGFAFDSLQVNSQFPSAQRNSDHDPAVARFTIPAAAADALEFTFWRDALFPGAPQPAQWRDPATGTHYRADGGLTEDSATATDSATGASPNRFVASAGDAAISRVDYASGQGFGTAGGATIATLDWQAPGQALLRLDAAWNSLKTLAIEDFTGEALRVEGIVDVLVGLAGAEDDLAVTLDGIKRGSVRTGDGDDTITIGFDSNETRWNNTMVINTGAGDDVITIGAASRDYVGGRWSLRDSSTIVAGGAGDDVLTGAATRDTAVFAGNAADYAIAVDAAGITTVIDANLADGDDGTDTIGLFEFLRFADRTVEFSGGVWA